MTECTGLCQAWENADEEQIEEDNLRWCSKCYLHVKPERTHCPCCMTRGLYGRGTEVEMECLGCNKPFMVLNKQKRFCSTECRRKRKLQINYKYNQRHLEAVRALSHKHNRLRGAKRFVGRLRRNLKYGITEMPECTGTDHLWSQDGDHHGKCDVCGAEWWKVFKAPD